LIRAVLLDAVGTLLRLREPVGETYARVGAAHGVQIGAWRLEDAFRRVRAAAPPLAFPSLPTALVPAREREAWRELVRSTFLAADSAQRVGDFDACFDALWRHFASAAAWALRPGAAEALSALRARGRRVAVVSNFDHRLPAILAGLGVAQLLEAVVLPADAGAAKPDPRIFRVALDRLGALPAEAVCVGDDRERDLAAARALGVRAIDVASLATLAELPARIEALEGGGEP
jgi:putative hydrolase of the HAD superfamily